MNISLGQLDQLLVTLRGYKDLNKIFDLSYEEAGEKLSTITDAQRGRFYALMYNDKYEDLIKFLQQEGVNKLV